MSQSQYNFQLEKGKIRKYFPKTRAGVHKFVKKMKNRIIRRMKIVPVKGTIKNYSGWEF